MNKRKHKCALDIHLYVHVKGNIADQSESLDMFSKYMLHV